MSLVTTSQRTRQVDIDQAIAGARRELLAHPLYAAIERVEDLRHFMSQHVFAVWDFMSLLKRLQREVSCSSLPWLPPADTDACRFIQEIVLGEECDEDGRGGFASHFELYLESMEELGAETGPIRLFVRQLQEGVPWPVALETAPILPSTRRFVEHTLTLVEQGTPPEVAAAFFYGREDVIPDMFARLIDSLQAHGLKTDRLVHYLKRHIELDGDSHGPLSQQLLNRLCNNDPAHEQRALAAATQAVELRLCLWDGILHTLPGR
jgi:hypothetical protein